MDVVELWWLSLAIAGIVVLVVAVLLGLIIAAAKRIDGHAAAIWITGKDLAGNTVSIWMLEDANSLLRRIMHATRGLERNVRSLDETVRTVAAGRR